MSDTNTTAEAVANLTRTMKISGHEFVCEDRYAEGHVLTANEAAALNGLRRENLRNNFAAKIANLLKQNNISEPTPEILAKLHEMFEVEKAEYQFNVRRRAAGASEGADPIDKLTYSLARQLLTNMLKANGLKVKDVSEEDREALIEELIAGSPDIRKTAEAQYAQKQALKAASSSFKLGSLPAKAA